MNLMTFMQYSETISTMLREQLKPLAELGKTRLEFMVLIDSPLRTF